MGSGKSTVGRLVAGRLNLSFVDLDSLVEERLGMSIPRVFSAYGEDFFREAETRVLEEVSRSFPPSVVATGGGIVLRESNWEIMQASGEVVYLHAPVEVLWERVSHSTNRPLARDEERFRELWLKRLPLYRKARIEVESYPKTPEEVAREVLGALGLTY